MWGIWQEKVFEMLTTDLDDLIQRLRMEWAKLDRVIIIAAAICHWR